MKNKGLMIIGAIIALVVVAGIVYVATKPKEEPDTDVQEAVQRLELPESTAEAEAMETAEAAAMETAEAAAMETTEAEAMETAEAEMMETAEAAAMETAEAEAMETAEAAAMETAEAEMMETAEAEAMETAEAEAMETAEAAAMETAEAAAMETAEAAAMETTEAEMMETAEAEMMETAEAETESATAETQPVASEPKLFRIVPEESTAEFHIDETLRGKDIIVVGTTNEVAGDVIVNPGNPSESQVGQILINARTLETPDTHRNEAIRRFILSTDKYEVITFDPAELLDMPESVAVGDEFTFTVRGDLTIKETTQSVDFTVTVTVVADGRIEGYAETVIRYEDFDANIPPDVPGVTFVGEEATLILNFVATEVVEASDVEATPEVAGEEVPQAEETLEVGEIPDAEVEEMPEMEVETVMAGPKLLRIVPEESTAEFHIDETLRGDDIVVVGTTNEVAGDVIVNPGSPSESQVGQILINARTFETPESRRNEAIRRFILSTDTYETITFDPTELLEMPESVAVGDEFTFTVRGDLTIKETTKSVDFTITVTAVAEDRIQGHAETVIKYDDFGANVPPNVPGVTHVGDEATLILNFVATEVTE